MNWIKNTFRYIILGSWFISLASWLSFFIMSFLIKVVTTYDIYLKVVSATLFRLFCLSDREQSVTSSKLSLRKQNVTLKALFVLEIIKF